MTRVSTRSTRSTRLRTFEPFEQPRPLGVKSNVALWLVASTLSTAACGTESSSAPSPCTESRDVVGITSDYTSSAVSAFRIADKTLETRQGVDLGKDPQLSLTSDRMFLVARDQDVVFELDPSCGAPIKRISVHDEAAKGIQNAQDVALDSSGALWVPRFNDGSLLVVGADGARTVASLEGYDDDRNPEPASVRIARTSRGERAFVTLERLDFVGGKAYVSRRPSMLLELDTTTRKPVATHTLLGRNPFGALVEHEGRLLLAEPGDFDVDGEADAGVESFDPETSTSRMLVGERELGGSVSEVRVSGACGMAIVAGPQKDVNPTALVSFDLRTGQAVQPASRAPLATAGYDLQALAVVSGAVFVGDRRRAENGQYPVHVFDVAGDCTLTERLGQEIYLPQKPVALRSRLPGSR